jgi:hypothetical protein
MKRVIVAVIVVACAFGSSGCNRGKGQITNQKKFVATGTVESVSAAPEKPTETSQGSSGGTKYNRTGRNTRPPAKAETEPAAPKVAMDTVVKLDDGETLKVTVNEQIAPGSRVNVVSEDGRVQMVPQPSNRTFTVADELEWINKKINSVLGPQNNPPTPTPTPSGPPQGVAYYTWDQYQGFPTVMMGSGDGICLLQGVTGNFRGGGEAVWIRNNGTNWELNGTSQQSAVSARAMCVPFSAIQGADQGINYLIGTASAWATYNGCAWYETCHGNGEFLDLWGQDSFCYLTGMSGEFNGGGEIISINPWAADHWYMMVFLQAEGGYIRGEAGCLSLVGHSLLRVTAGATPGYPSERYEWNQGDSWMQLPNEDRAFCGLDWITGHFQGGGENVDIYHNPDNTQWLGGNSQQAGVGVQASCMYYDQR